MSAYFCGRRILLSPRLQTFWRSALASSFCLPCRCAATDIEIRICPRGRKRRERPCLRVKRGTKRRARRKKLLKHAKGFFLTKGKLFRSAKEAVNRSLRYTYRDRRVRKRDYRTLWIQRIGAAARNNGITYNQLIHGLKVAGIDLDRKILADMAVLDADGFAALVATAKQHFPAPTKARQVQPSEADFLQVL